MEKISLHGRLFRPFISNAEIESAIDGVACKIRSDFNDAKEPPVFLCVLNGAIMFTSAIMKRVNIDAELISIKMTSYSGTSSTGEVFIPMGLTGSVTGRNVIIFEDIVDTGNTIRVLRDLLISKGASDIKVCTMLFKPEVYTQDIKLDYVGMEIPNRFIVGYGLDYDELGRNYKDIYILDE